MNLVKQDIWIEVSHNDAIIDWFMPTPPGILDKSAASFLKPIKQVYVLTEKELEKLLVRYEMDMTLEQFNEGNPSENAIDFLNSITNK